MGGLKGAAEYERLIGRKGVANLFIIIGNVAFFASGRGKRT
jgi:hypothetical protein